MTLWAREEASRRRAGATDALEAARTAKEEADALIDAQRQACIDAGIEDVTNPRDNTLKAIERTRERAAQIELALESAKEIGQMVRALEERGVVSRELGKHLKVVIVRIVNPHHQERCLEPGKRGFVSPQPAPKNRICSYQWESILPEGPAPFAYVCGP